MIKIKSLITTGTIILAIATASAASAAQILFAHVDSYGSYFDDGNRIRDMLSSGGHSVTTRVLDQAIYDDYSSFDQIFVYDLYHYSDNSAVQMANYSGIANWYNGLTDQNLILDGRIISSDLAWTNPAETQWVQNYATQLDLRGGGLFLGTDHAANTQGTGAFVDGINYINDGIGVDRFQGYYYTPPLEAVVDQNSPLHITGLEACSSNPSLECINDNSSTSFVATGLQSNGQTLTPVAYHGTVSQAWDQAAVSSTMGSITFGTCGGANQPSCDVPEPSIIVLFAAGLFGIGFVRRRQS